MAELATTSLPWDLQPGDPFNSDDGRTYVFERIDPDGIIYVRGRINSGHGDLMVVGDDGMHRRPTCEEFLAMLAEGTLIRVSPPLKDPIARKRREADLDDDQARALDEDCDFRTAMVRELDEAIREHNQSRSDRQLAPFIARCLRKKAIGRLPGAWKCSPATLRHWWKTRGEPGSRRTSDGVSDTGRTPKARKINHPIEIIAYWSSRAVANRSPTLQIIRDYRAELDDINNGRPLHRYRAAIGENAGWVMTQEPVAYEKPASPYLPMSQDAFYSLVRAMRSKKSYAIETSAKGARQRYEGGGVTEIPSRIGVLGQIDDTPVPNLFLVDDLTGIPLGGATLTLLIETVSRLALGWDLSWDHASTNTVLRTVLHSNRPKFFPEAIARMAEDESGTELAKIRRQALTWGYRVARLLGDNLAGYHGREVEDALLDATISHEFTEKERPRAKPHVERVLGTLQEMLFKKLPDSRLDAELAKRFGYDPDTQVLCTLARARELLDTACIIYNMTRHEGLDGKQPSLVHHEHLARYKVSGIADEAVLKRALARGEKNVEIDNTGVRVFGQRYSATGKTSRLIQDHERATRKRCNHGGPDQKRFVRSHKRKMTFKVRIKYDEDDLGQIHVWNPHVLPQGEWITLECTNPRMRGRPKWLHDRILDLAREAADGHLDKNTEDRLHALLHREITNVTEQSSERDLRDHAKAMESPQVMTALQNWIEVHDEDREFSGLDDAPAGSIEIADEDDDENGPFPIDVDQSPRKDWTKISPRPGNRKVDRGSKRAGPDRPPGRTGRPDRKADRPPKKTKRRYGGLTWKDIA